MDVKAEALKVLVKHAKALLIEEVELVMVPALEEVAKKSATPLDDVAIAALKQPLIDAVKKQLEKIVV
jgi:hypothetical protein